MLAVLQFAGHVPPQPSLPPADIRQPEHEGVQHAPVVAWQTWPEAAQQPPLQHCLPPPHDVPPHTQPVPSLWQRGVVPVQSLSQQTLPLPVESVSQLPCRHSLPALAPLQVTLLPFLSVQVPPAQYLPLLHAMSLGQLPQAVPETQ
jgi:hypothetical protein